MNSTPRLFMKSYRKVISQLLACILTLATITPLHAQAPLTLQEAIQIALNNNATMGIARGHEAIAKARFHIGNAGFLPIVDAYINTHAQRNINLNKATTAHITPGVEAKWSILNGPQNYYTYRHLGHRYRTSQLQTQKITEESIAAVIEEYYALALAQQQQRVLQQAVDIAQEVLDFTQQQYAVGKLTQLDYLIAQVEYNNEQAQLITHKAELRNTQMKLQNLLGQEYATELTVVDTIPPPQKLDWQTLSQDVTSTSATLQIAQQRCLETTTSIRKSYANLWPQIDLLVGYKGEKKYYDKSWVGTIAQGLYGGIAVKLNLFHALQHYSAVQVAYIQSDQAQLQLKAQKQQIMATLRQQYACYQQQIACCAIVEQHARVSQQSVKLALEQYRLGKVTLLTLHKAKYNAQKTVLQQLKATHDAKITEVKLQLLCGKLRGTA